MRKGFELPSAEELARRGLAPDGTPLKAEEPKKKPGRPKKDVSSEDS